jgi:hypothetical protein
METYRWLDAKDIRGPSAIDDLSDLASSKLAKKLHHKDAGDLGQGTYVKSWIWCVAVTDNTDPEDTLRGEWARCAANSARWEEERELVPIEMGRTLAAFKWEAQRWKACIGTRPSASPALQHARPFRFDVVAVPVPFQYRCHLDAKVPSPRSCFSMDSSETR